MIHVELTQAEVDRTSKIAKAMYSRRRQDNRVATFTTVYDTPENLDMVNALARVAVAKFMDLTYKEVKKLSKERKFTAEFRRDGLTVPLWIKSTRKYNKGVGSMFFPARSKFPQDKVPMIACQIINDYLVEIAGWMFTTELLEKLYAKQTKFGTNWAILTTDLHVIESFEPIFEQVLEVMKKNKQDWHIVFKHLSTPTSLDSKARLV